MSDLLVCVPDYQADKAWEDGADCLGESCSEDCTKDQLKYVLARGERQLVRMDSNGKTVGWGVFKVEQFPNMRVFHVTNLVAHNGRFQKFYEQLTDMANRLGCSRIRCCAKPSQARLYAMKLGFESVYTTLEKKLC